MRKNKVVIGFLGTQLDSGRGAGRWEKWRPTVSLVQHEDVVIERLELLYTPQHRELAHQVRTDMATASPETTVNLVPLPIADPWDFGEVYAQLYDWTQAYRFDTEREEYWTHITTGTHVAQICLFLLVESRRIPGVLVQTSPPKRQQMGNPGSYTLIDLDLSRYDVIAQRFGAEQQDAVQFLKSGIATRNARFNALIDEVERVAVRSRAPILFTGPTGAGKTTCVDLILGLLSPQSGALRVDGTVIDEGNVRGWQKSVGYVPQEIFLIDDTVAANIAFGVPRDEIDIEAVRAAARVAELDEFVTTLPQGYATEVGERGARLSGGQRQRIGIARALYSNPDILVFDEATSALDNLTERAIMAAIGALGHSKTIVVIAHRLSTVRHCDMVYLLRDGRVEAADHYEGLVAKNDHFRALHEATA